jgi:hypothetical protein
MSEPKITIDASSWNRVVRERDEAREELARIESLLLDPHAVFLNFLHGKIAKLDWAKLEHIHGPHPARVERDEARELAQQMSDSNQVLLADVQFYRNAWEQLKEATK